MRDVHFCSLLKPLVSDQLLKRSNINVKLEVAYCICEVTKITVSDVPYDDTNRKVSELIVLTF